jgi:hypothetical protein
MRLSILRLGICLILSVCIGGSSSLVLAQVAGSCTACVRSEGCDNKRSSCSSECRARIFSVDPRRAECLAKCLTDADRCAQAALSSCRELKAC